MKQRQLESEQRQLNTSAFEEEMVVPRHNPSFGLNHSGSGTNPNHHFLQTQRTFGNRYTQNLIQAKLKAGPVNDKYEQEADRVAHQVSQKLSRNENEPTDTIQRHSVTPIQHSAPNQGVPVFPHIEAGIQQALGGGRPLPGPVRERIEHSFGADFTPVRIHTDDQAHKLNQSINALAFTTGNDIFFRRDAYETNTTSGQTLLAHELTHVVQQSPQHRPSVIQSVKYKNKKGNTTYYPPSTVEDQGGYFVSHADAWQVVTNDTGVVSVVNNLDDKTGGHAMVYVEYLENGRPVSYLVHLVTNPQLDIKIPNVQDDVESDEKKYWTPLQHLEANFMKRTWAVARDSIDAILAKARHIKANIDQYYYYYPGASLHQKALNCARFAQIILNEAPEIDISAGTLAKIPKNLVKGRTPGSISALDEEWQKSSIRL